MSNGCLTTHKPEGRMNDRDARWLAVVEHAYKEAADRMLQDVRCADRNVYDLNKLWKKSTARNMAKQIAKEAT